MPQRHPNGTAIIAVSSTFFALMALSTRALAGSVPFGQVAFLRFVVGLLACGVVMLSGWRPKSQTLGLLGLRGVLGGLSVVTYFFAIERLGAAPATVLNYSSPIFASVFAWWFLGERAAGIRRLGLAVATLGAIVVTFSTAPAQSMVPSLGALLGVASAVFGGAAMTVIRTLRLKTDSWTVFFAFCTVGAVLSAPLAFASWVPMTAHTASLCLGVGVLSVAGQVLFTWGLGFTSATTGSAVTQVVPALSWLMATTWLAEPISLGGAFGALMCVGGVLLGVVPWAELRLRAATKPAP